MITKVNRCLNLYVNIVVILITLIFLPNPASSEETYVFERMWPSLQQPWYFNSPWGIALDNSGFIYVTEMSNNRIQKFTKDGEFISKWGSEGSDNGQFNVPLGIVVDDSDFVYVADRYNYRIQKFTKDGEFISKWGSEGSKDGEFDSLWGIATDKDGFVYVADTGNSRIQKFTKDGQFVSKWGTYGTGNGQFSGLSGIATDKDGFVYVADTFNDRIQKFTKDGELVGKWGASGNGDGQFFDPCDIAIDSSGFVYVADNGNHRIQKFTKDGQFLDKWGGEGSGDGKFYHPTGILVDKNGFVYVVDYYNNRIQKFTSVGQFVGKWGSSGSGDGELYLPHGIALDTSGFVYVVDYYNNRIQKFTSSGQFVTKWGSEGSGNGEFELPMGISVDKGGFVYVVDMDNHRIQKFTSSGQFVDKWGSSGNRDGQFYFPSGVAVDSSGFVYVADSGNDRIQKFTSDGRFVGKWGSLGNGDGEFHFPMGTAVDRNGFVYVADTNNDRIQKFTSSGQFVDKWGSSGNGDGQFKAPYGIATDNKGFTYVADTNNNRIQKFTSSGQFVDKWGSLGSDPGQFAGPAGLCIDEGGRVYVSDRRFNRIQVFKKETVHTNNKAIIVAGGGPYAENNIWEETEMCANHAYRALTYQGFTKDSIYYLSSNTDLDLDGNDIPDDVDGDATSANLQSAITTWSKDAENLFIYMVDHGGDGIFVMSAHEHLKAEDLDTWLDTLQDTIPGNVTLVYDACMSGSFIPILDPPSGKERILVTSTSKDEAATISSQGRTSFGWFFFGNMFNGDSFYDSFVYATDSMGDTYHPQHPLLEGNGNGIGNEKEDQDIVRSLTIGNEIKSAGDIPTIGSVSPAQTLDGETSALIYADNIIDANGISSVWAVITPPGYSSGSPDNPVTDLPTIDLSPAGNNRYECTYNNFISGGTYNIAIFASDRGNAISFPRATTVTVSQDYGSDIYEEDDTSGHANVINLNGDPQRHSVHDAGDRDWVKFYGIAEETYEIEVNKPSSHCDAVIELYDTDGATLLKGPRDSYNEGEDELMSWRCTQDGIYHVMIRQYDPGVFGDNTEYDLKIYRPICHVSGFIDGTITDAYSGESIGGAIITTDNNVSALIPDDGVYLMPHPAGTFTVTANAPGYAPVSYSKVEVSEGEISTQSFTLVPLSNSNDSDGDVAPLGNRDGTVNVGDALVALRFALLLETPTQEDIEHGDVAPLNAQGQPNPDGVINVGDALVILRKALGIIGF